MRRGMRPFPASRLSRAPAMVLARRSLAEPSLARLRLIARPPIIVAFAGFGIAMVDMSIVRPALCMHREEEAAAGKPRASDGHWGELGDQPTSHRCVVTHPLAPLVDSAPRTLS